MRIEKRVSCILKQNIDTSLLVSDRDGYTAQTFDGWFKTLVHEVIGEPAVDAIFATYGLSADLLSEVSIYASLSEYASGKPEVHAKLSVSNDFKDAAIEFDVPLWQYEAGLARDDAKTALVHEIEHYARFNAGLLGYPAYGNLRGLEAHLAGLNDPQEHAAIKAAMFDLIETGLSDREIIATMVDDYLATGDVQPEDLSEEFKMLATKAEEMMARLLAEAHEEYADFITV